MKIYDNLKYARRAGSDITLVATIQSVGRPESRGALRMLRLEITDGRMVFPMVLFGDAAGRNYRAGQRVRAGPAYWSDQWENFSLVKGGSVAVS